MFKANINNCSQQELLFCCFCDHVSPNINKLWLLLLPACLFLTCHPGISLKHTSRRGTLYTYNIYSYAFRLPHVNPDLVERWEKNKSRGLMYTYTREIRCGGLTPACGSVHARGGRGCRQIEPTSVTVLSRGALRNFRVWVRLNRERTKRPAYTFPPRALHHTQSFKV